MRSSIRESGTARRAGGPRRVPDAAGLMLGATLLVAMFLMAAAGPVVYRSDPWTISGSRFVAPNAAAPLGRDHLGRDVLAGVIQGSRISLAVGIAATGMILVIGTVIGALAGYCGGALDEALMRITEFFQSVPAFLFAMVVVVVFAPSFATIITAIGVANWAATARLVRAQFLSIKEREFVLAARALGVPGRRIILREILPNSLSPIVVNTALTVGSSILFETGLSFLGLGDPNVMSWGYMLSASRPYLRQAWWSVTFPGLAIFVTVLGLNLMGDGLNAALNRDQIGRQPTAQKVRGSSGSIPG